MTQNTTGFSCLMMMPRGARGVHQQTPAEMAADIQATMGDNKLSTTFLQSVTQVSMHIPKNCSEALDQLHGTVQFLELLTRTGDDSLASQPYKWIIRFIDLNFNRIRELQISDPSTLCRLLHTADVIFQQILEKIRGAPEHFTAQERLDYVYSPSVRIDQLAHSRWGQVLANYETLGRLDHLSLPSNLAELSSTALSQLSLGSDGVLSRKRKAGPLDADPPRGPPKKEFEVGAKNPKVGEQFKLPDQPLQTIFPGELRKDLPKVPYNSNQPRKGKSTPCLRFHCRGLCPDGDQRCRHSHLSPANMDAADRQQFVEVIAKARANL